MSLHLSQTIQIVEFSWKHHTFQTYILRGEMYLYGKLPILSMILLNVCLWQMDEKVIYCVLEAKMMPASCKYGRFEYEDKKKEYLCESGMEGKDETSFLHL